MTWLDVVAAVWIALLVVALVGMGRMAWRLVHHNEQIEAGGSLGDQILGTKNAGASVKRASRTRK